MKKARPSRRCFWISAGVLLSDGWYLRARKQAAAHFKLEWAEMEERHQLNFDTFEEGKLTSGRIFDSGGLSSKATFPPGSVSKLHVRAIETFPPG